MTISTTTNKKIYDGDDATLEFAYDFKIQADAELDVYLFDPVTGEYTAQELDSDYTVSGAGDATGGNVTFDEAPSSDYQVVIIRDTTKTQASDYSDYSTFPADTIEDALDKITAAVQDVSERVDRAILYPKETSNSGSIRRGTSAAKPTSCSAGDIYLATDTAKVYICFVDDTWTLIN